MDIKRIPYSRLANIEPGLLLTFLLVGEEENLTRAAERRHTTPSAASAQLRLLEQRLGVSLFTRSRRGMSITAEGKALLEPASRALDALAAVLGIADSLSGGIRGRARLGLNSPPEFLRLTPLLAKLRDRAPEVEIAVLTSLSGRIIRQVMSGELEAGFVFSVDRPRGVEAYRLADVEVRAIAPPDWPDDRLPDNTRILAGLPWIEPDGDCPLRQLFALLLGDAAARCRVVLRSDGEASTLALVKAGLGIGLLDRNYAEEALRAGAVKILEPPMTVGLHLILPSGSGPDPLHDLLKSSVLSVWTDDPSPAGASAEAEAEAAVLEPVG